MDDFEHGGDAAQAARELGIPLAEILDFSASINPLGMPGEVLEAARRALEEAEHYPEVDAVSLISDLSRFHDIPAEHFLAGNGSTELIYLFPRVMHPRHALLVAPAFSEYARSLQLEGAEIDLFALRAQESFRFDPELLLHRLAPDHDLILFANPGNPTGVGIDPATVEAIAYAVREQAVVAVDEAFVDFCPELSVLSRVPHHSNLYVFRSFTKFYAIPGLRAGYLAGPALGISHLKEAQEPWALSAPALAAARACLPRKEFRHRTLETVSRLREQLATGLSALGVHPFPSRANYLLARLENGSGTAAELAALLRPQGILIRDCANFFPLDERYLRVAVRREAENERLLAALRMAR